MHHQTRDNPKTDPADTGNKKQKIMLRVYRTWIDGKEKLVKANSKKDVRNAFGVEVVEFWCNITKKDEALLSNLPVAESK